MCNRSKEIDIEVLKKKSVKEYKTINQEELSQKIYVKATALRSIEMHKSKNKRK